MSEPVSSPEIGSRQSKSMKGQSEWLVVGHTQNVKGGAVGHTSLTSSFSHGDMGADGMVRGSLKKVEQEDPLTAGQKSLRRNRSPDPFNIAALKDP